MAKIEIDPERLMTNGKRTIEMGEGIGEAGTTMPSGLDVGDDGGVVQAILNAVSVWAAEMAEVHVAVGEIMKKVANETVELESEILEGLTKIDASVGLDL